MNPNAKEALNSPEAAFFLNGNPGRKESGTVMAVTGEVDMLSAAIR